MYRRRHALVVLCALAIGAVASLTASGAGADLATLKTIASRIDGRAGVIAIEASAPVAYVAAQPNPQTFVIELRDIEPRGFLDNFTPDPRHPFSAISVERAHAADGATVARVQMTLAHPVRPRVRSARNIIYVEAGRLDRAGQAVQPAVVQQVQVATPQIPAIQLLQAQAAPAPAPQVLQAPQAPQAPTLPGTVPQRFTGFPISLDFQGADLRAVLRTFSEISGLNVVIDPTIQGTVDVALRDVPWDQALDIILQANQLGYSVEGTVVRISPLRVLAAEQAERQKLAEAQALAGELETLTRTLSYARAEQVQPLITTTVLSQRGSITTDPRTNTLIIRDLPERLATIGGLIATLDRPEPQVEIEARIVQTNRDYARELGVQWGFNGRATTQTGNTLPLAFPNQAEVGGRVGGTQGPEGAGTTVNLPATIQAPTSAIGLALGSINGALNLDVALSALESTGNGRILSTPRVTTQNNIEAQIQQGI